MPRLFFVLGALLTGIAVVLGAFGAHLLTVDADRLGWWKTGVLYHLVHGLALLAVSWACSTWPGPWIRAAGFCFVAGVVVFSGSLYAMTLTGITRLGAITPVGGLLLIAGWSLLAWGVFRAG